LCLSSSSALHFSDSFLSTTLSTGMTVIPLHMQWPLLKQCDLINTNTFVHFLNERYNKKNYLTQQYRWFFSCTYLRDSLDYIFPLHSETI
jgi:hypothetical protein